MRTFGCHSILRTFRGQAPTATHTFAALPPGTYRVEAESSLSSSNWVALATNTVSGGVTGASTETNGGLSSMRFYRVARTGLATYDPVGSGSGGGTSSVVPGGSASRGTTVCER